MTANESIRTYARVIGLGGILVALLIASPGCDVDVTDTPDGDVEVHPVPDRDVDVRRDVDVDVQRDVEVKPDVKPDVEVKPQVPVPERDPDGGER